MSGIYLSSQRLFSFIGSYYELPQPGLFGIKLALVTAMGIHMIQDANRYDGEYRKVLYHSRLAQTIVAVISAIVIALFCQTLSEMTIGLVVSYALISCAGVYYKQPFKETLVSSLFLSIPLYAFSVYYNSSPE